VTFQYIRIYSAECYDELEKMWQEAVNGLIQEVSQNLLGGTKENHEES
jgi:hypothetical protein